MEEERKTKKEKEEREGSKPGSGLPPEQAAGTAALQVCGEPRALHEPHAGSAGFAAARCSAPAVLPAGGGASSWGCSGGDAGRRGRKKRRRRGEPLGQPEVGGGERRVLYRRSGEG